MASFNRFMRRAMARGKKPHQATYKAKPHGGHPAEYEQRDNTVEDYAGKLFPGSVKGFNPFTGEGA